MGHQRRASLDPGQRRRLHAEPQGRREPHRADHPEGVFLEAGPRVADGAQDAGSGIDDPAVRIHERRALPVGRPSGRSAPRHRIHGEVAAGQVRLDRVAEFDPMRSAEIRVVVIDAERRDLDDRVVLGPDRDRAEAVLVDGAREDRLDLPGPGRRGEIPVERGPADDHVADGATDDVRGVAAGPERSKDRQDGGRDSVGDQALGHGRGRDQFRPMNRYDRHASLRSSAR